MYGLCHVCGKSIIRWIITRRVADCAVRVTRTRETMGAAMFGLRIDSSLLFAHSLLQSLLLVLVPFFCLPELLIELSAFCLGPFLEFPVLFSAMAAIRVASICLLFLIWLARHGLVFLMRSARHGFVRIGFLSVQFGRFKSVKLWWLAAKYISQTWAYRS